MNANSTNEIVVALAAWSFPCVRSRHPCQAHGVTEKCKRSLFFCKKNPITCGVGDPTAASVVLSTPNLLTKKSITNSPFFSYPKGDRNLPLTMVETLSHKRRKYAFLTLSTLWLDPLHSNITEVPGKGYIHNSPLIGLSSLQHLLGACFVFYRASHTPRPHSFQKTR